MSDQSVNVYRVCPLQRKESYPDFVHLRKSSFPQNLAEDVAWAFNKMEMEGFFSRHWVVVRGRHAQTPVSRALVGRPGMTYRYLGLRIFALPWSFDREEKELNEMERACHIVGRLNTLLKSTSGQILRERMGSGRKDGESACHSGQRQNTTQHGQGDQESIKAAETKDHIHEGHLHEECQVENPNIGIAESAEAQTHEPVTEQANRGRDERNISKSNGRSFAERISDDKEIASDAVDSSVRYSKRKQDHEDGEEGREEERWGQRPKKVWRPGVRAYSVEEGTDFNVALINFMDPMDPGLDLRPEPHYGMGPLAVSWHMDGNLIRGSTVAVYSYTCEPANESPEPGRDWMVGIRKPWDTETKGLAACLESGDAYFMLADLNDTHQHCVIAGDLPRFASTHRVVDSSKSTLEYIQGRCALALQNLVDEDDGTNRPLSLRSLDSEAISLAEEVHNEVEFEWLRQFWMQGARHAAERTYWIKPMEELELAWEKMEHMTKLAVDAALEGDSAPDQVVTLLTTVLPYLETRERLRCEWTNRFSGDVLLSMEPDRLPIYRPTWDDGDPSRPLPFNLVKLLKRLRARLQEVQQGKSPPQQ
ncbi:alpha-ketoglutarate-dependent dioxygenase FTO-like [Diadema setosum]|uniref:alpha-ketoglutarate-dependent dioxygenase FTO-like n=1 Tax=Diadema setosum TaxID=31175 RepID=UPI003B3BBE75